MDVVFACVAEPQKRFLDQAGRLLLSLRWFGGDVANARFVVGLTGAPPTEAARFLEALGAELVGVEPFGGHGPSNKVVMAASPALDGHEVAVLLDCDTLVVQDPSPWLGVAGLGAKIADYPTIAADELDGIFHHVGLEPPERRFRHSLRGEACATYCNSGVVAMREEVRAVFTRDWARWNKALADAPELVFDRYYLDQASMALAIASCGASFEALPNALNVPAHLIDQGYPEEWHDLDPVIVHYHWHAYPTGYVKPRGPRQCARRIEAFNARLRAERVVSPPVHPPVEPRRVARREGPKVVVGSGWWCDEAPHEWSIGSARTRSTDFFDLWYRQIVRCLAPECIVITDSAAPIKPDFVAYDRVSWVPLDRNYGHANDLRAGKIGTKYSGFTRSVINGATFAVCCDADYYVYVEQDCLLRGDGLLEAALSGTREDILLGRPTEGGRGLAGGPAAPFIQQSFMVVRRAGLERFLSQLLTTAWSDGDLPPEHTMRLRLWPYGFVSIPYGRSRPIDFARTHFYVQHLDEDELARFLEVEEVRMEQDRFAFALPERPQEN